MSGDAGEQADGPGAVPDNAVQHYEQRAGVAGVPGRRGAAVQIQFSRAGTDLRAGAGGHGVRSERGVVYADEAEPAPGRAGHRAAGPAQPFRAAQICI
ncbi:hypothetical protein DW651_19350 [Subdoligranulum sp. AM23-21AC]|nr:hypothetical protein DW651_19350 [Subdoligranulum sp. AM23-21AC]